ncbi:MAG TPA: hypothetical protein VGG01_13715 [Xanthobacteraceae bacterium]|jgi:hypothetical protein
MADVSRNQIARWASTMPAPDVQGSAGTISTNTKVGKATIDTASGGI